MTPYLKPLPSHQTIFCTVAHLSLALGLMLRSGLELFEHSNGLTHNVSRRVHHQRAENKDKTSSSILWTGS